MSAVTNRPFASCLKHLFQSEAKCEAIDMKMILYGHENRIHFHNEGFALSLRIVRGFGIGNVYTWKQVLDQKTEKINNQGHSKYGF